MEADGTWTHRFPRSWRKWWGVWKRESKRALLRGTLRQALPVTYRAWITRSEPSPADLARQRTGAEAIASGPRIAVGVSALHGASEASVMEQSYDRWALVVFGDSAHQAVGQVEDPRIINESRNHCTVADFILPLRPGDILAPHALFEIAALLNRDPDADLVYFDEDRISEDGKTRHSPFFKPDWSPEMALSVNYLEPAVVRRSILDRFGATGEDLLGPRARDVLLRCAERARGIRHIPKVLCHRWAPTPLPGEDEMRAVEGHLRRLGIRDPRAALVRPDVVRVTWAPQGSKVSIIIPNKNHSDMLRRCVTSILERTSYRNFEILVVDTGSTEAATMEYYARLASHPQIRVLDHPGPFNYSRVNNAGARRTDGEILLFLNNDTEILDPDWLEELVRWAERPATGAVGAKLLYPGGSIQHAGIVLGMYGLMGHIYRYADETHADIFGSVDWYRNYLAVTGACMMMRREVFDRIGGFDEAYEVAFSDVEICLRIVRHGYRIVYTPFARLHHHEGATRGRYNPPRDTRRALHQMRAMVEAGDPYFNPNLSYESAIPSLPQWMDRPRTKLLQRLVNRTSTS